MLTTRQKEIAVLVGQGLSTKAIAQQTGLAVPTVKRHLRLAALRLPGDTPTRHKLMLWFFTTKEPVEPLG
jgi:DNA-binding NarL/FixJ family response regulator